MNPLTPPNGHRLCRPLLLLTLSTLLASACLAQGKPPKSELRDIKREMLAESPGTKPNKPDFKADARGGRSNPGDAASRSMAKLREYLEVADEAEWEVIAERIQKLTDLRGSLWTGAAGSRGGPSLGDKGKRSAGSKASAHPEQDALRSALKDKLPDAEIKARLARAHEVFEQNEARLARAQAELRAVLTVRQEAVAVMAGLLPP